MVMQKKSFLVVEKYTDYEYLLLQKPEITEKDKELQNLLQDHLDHQKTKDAVIAFLTEQNVEFKIIKADQIEEIDYQNYSSVISLGGDGTFLKAAKKIDKQEILGINSVPKKSVGHLAKFTRKNFQGAILDLISSRASVDFWDRIGVSLNGKNLNFRAVNEIFIGVSKIYKTSHLKIEVDQRVGEVSGNGLIVSTHQGSSGFYQSSGGSYFESENFGYVFLFPYKIKGKIHSNMVLDKDTHIKVTPTRFHHQLVFDGDETTEIELNQDDVMEVFLDSKKPLKVISLPE